MWRFLALLCFTLPAPAFAWTFSGGTPAEHARVDKATEILKSAPAGRQVLQDLGDYPITIEIDRSGDSNGAYDDEYKALTLSSKALAKWPDWKLARLLCHELTHAVQDRLGINRANYDNADTPVSSSGVAEFSALSMEVRFWIEIGAPVDGADFNMLRMQAYLFYPETVRIGWAWTNSSERFKEPVSGWADERLARYWAGVQESEKSWRASTASKFPARYREPAIALVYLKERYGKPVSPWLPLYLENPSVASPSAPTANDRELIGLHRLIPPGARPAAVE